MKLLCLKTHEREDLLRIIREAGATTGIDCEPAEDACRDLMTYLENLRDNPRETQQEWEESIEEALTLTHRVFEAIPESTTDYVDEEVILDALIREEMLG